MSSGYHFDAIISRKNTQSLKWDKYGDSDIIPLWVADMDFATAPEIVESLQTRLEHPIFGYCRAPDTLVNALVSHLDDLYQWKIDPEWIVWLPGVVTGLAAGVRAYALPGSEVLINPPIYHHFFQVHNPEIHDLIEIPLRTEICEGDDGRASKRWTYDIDALSKAINDKTSLLNLCSPHNPTGTVFEREELRSVCELASKHNAVVVSDEIHCGLVINENRQHVPAALACPEYAESIVTLMSASKTYNLAGLNCSYAIIQNPELRKRYTDACAEVTPHIGPLVYTATEAAFTSGEQWRQQLLGYLRNNHDYLQQELADIPGLEMQHMDATYLAWIDATELGLNDTTGYFEGYGLGFSSGEQFGQPQFIRLNFACPRSTLETAVERIKKAVAALAN